MGWGNRISFRFITKLLLDAFAFALAFVVSHVLRFSFQEVYTHFEKIANFLPYIVLIRLLMFAVFRLYSSMWRYSSLHDLKNIVKAASAGSLLIVLLDFAFKVGLCSRFIMITDWVLVIFYTGAIRMVIRYFHENPLETLRNRQIIPKSKRILIYGAGRAGEMLLRSIHNTSTLKTGIAIDVIGFIDDDPEKIGKYIHEKRVIGTGKDLKELVDRHQITDIYFAIPALSGAETRQILQLIREQVNDLVDVKTIPGLRDLIQGRVTTNELRSFEIRDLLRRKPIHLDFTPVEKMIYNQRVMVVGGGGSIGRELCNQIAQFHPERLVVVDNSEFNVYLAESYLQRKYPNENIIFNITDAGNEPLIRKVFEAQRPQLIFHAAAYKHVPLMELNPQAAIVNNIRSTYILTQLSDEFNVDRFILISTDKAVKPSSVMGATKRICEQVTLLNNKIDGTNYIAVRFGNVLGSSGSVIPKFKQQIKNGEPITVTHPEVTRYFMLISEAVELVLQAGAIGKNGNIYVLDMGEPIKIVDLARYMIELSGLKVNEDVKIIYTGLRPGEKLHESLFLEGEESNTTIPNLFVLEPKLSQDKDFLRKVLNLVDTCQNKSNAEVRREIRELVPEYQVDNDLKVLVPKTITTDVA